MTTPLKVVVNEREIIIFRGATVIDAVRAYSADDARLLLAGELLAEDRSGHRTDPDGELSEGQKIKLVQKEMR